MLRVGHHLEIDFSIIVIIHDSNGFVGLVNAFLRSCVLITLQKYIIISIFPNFFLRKFYTKVFIVIHEGTNRYS